MGTHPPNHSPAHPSVIGWWTALLPSAVFAAAAALIPTTVAGGRYRLVLDWVPGLGANLTMVVDGLSLLFVMIISLVGTAVFIFAGGYLAGHPQLRWFYALLALFMFSMLGLVFLLGVAVHDMETGVTLRALAAICFMLLTAPVSAHLIGRAAYRSGIRLWDRTRVDELDD